MGKLNATAVAQIKEICSRYKDEKNTAHDDSQ